MSAYEDRTKSALIVIDVQNGVVDYAKNRNVIVNRIAGLVDRARAAGTDVIWVQHSEDDMPIDSEYWQIVPELKPTKDEKIIHKLWRSSFEETDLEEVLEELSVGHLIVTGAQSNYCVRHTIHAAIERGLDITLVGDAHTTMDESWEGAAIPAEMIVAELNRSCSNYDLPDSRVDVVSAELASF
jgi:nicotinamidase-related amidase